MSPNYMPKARKRSRNPVIPVDARPKALGLRSPWDVYEKLHWELDIYRDLHATKRCSFDEVDSRKRLFKHLYAGINAATTAWSLTEWFWHSLDGKKITKVRAEDIFGAENLVSCKTFQDHLRDEIRDFDVCHQICHAFKHAKFERRNTDTLNLHADAIFKIRQVGQKPPTIEVESAIGNPLRKHDDRELENVLGRLLGLWYYLLTECEVHDPRQIVVLNGDEYQF